MVFPGSYRAEEPTEPNHEQRTRRARKLKTSRYLRDEKEGEKVRRAREERTKMAKEREEALKRREEQRRRRNNTIGFGRRARTSTGQVKLGRQSKGLLEKVEALVGGSS